MKTTMTKKCKLKECPVISRCNGFCARHGNQLRRTGRVWMYNENDDNDLLKGIIKGTTFIILKNRSGEVVAKTLVDNSSLSKITERKWNFEGRYVGSSKNNKKIRLHTFLMGEKKGREIDHINNDPLDNRLSNLRFVTKTQNQGNKLSSKNSSSIYKGVSWNKKDKRWTVFISIKGKSIYKGAFKNEVEAAKLYNKEAEKLFGEYANLNIV